MLTIVTVSPFFLKKIEKHYELLNYTVFRKYNIITPTNEDYNSFDFLKITIDMPTNNYYEIAKLHIEKDCPGLSKKIGVVVNKIKTFNDEIDTLNASIDYSITNSFKQDTTIKCVYKYNINPYNIKNISIPLWRHVYNNMKPPMVIESFKSRLEDTMKSQWNTTNKRTNRIMDKYSKNWNRK